MSKPTGVEIVVACLKEQDVSTIFGYPGGAILNIYDALYQHRDEVTHILTFHEQGASYAADGYVRATDKAGVCLAASGPGATNLVIGIATAYMDSVPVAAITCNVTNSLLGKDSLQEIDTAGVAVPITKHDFVVRDVSRLATIIRRVFIMAQTGRPGPVLVDITKDATAAFCEYEKQVPEEVVRQSDTITEQSMDRAVEMIRKAAKLFIPVGGGAVLSNVSDELRIFVHKIQAPAADSLMGEGAFDGADELYTGMMGMYGTKTSNFGITEADLLIVVGVRFSDRVTGNASKSTRSAEIPQLDTDPAEINKSIRVDVSIIGDVKVILRKLNVRLDPVNHDEWIAHIGRMKDIYPLRYDKNMLTGPLIVRTINKMTGGDAVIATEAGQHQMWAVQYYQYRQPRTLLTSGRPGTMEYGLGAIIGVKMGCRDKTVINTIGDGCLHMNMNEIATVTRYNIPVAEVTVNNHMLGTVCWRQTLFHGKHYPQTVLNDSMDFVKMAEAMGIKAYRVAQKEELESVLREATPLNIPAVIDCQISCDDRVFPTILPGAPITDASDGTDLKVN